MYTYLNTNQQKETDMKSITDMKGFERINKGDIKFEEATLVWIGDPCYAPELNHSYDGDKTWSTFCEAYFKAQDDDKEEGLEEQPSYVFKHRGVEFVVGGTAHGDGCYDCSAGGSCGVDAGLLSVIPAGAFGLDPSTGDNYGGVFHTVSGLCGMDEDHTLYAGNITVVTGSICENCGALEDDCSCERCWGCGEWEDYCCCCDGGCGYPSYECQCEEEEEEEEEE
jgi:hypothetical protein